MSRLHQVSWEAVEEGETRPTLWVPDHAASQVLCPLSELLERYLSKSHIFSEKLPLLHTLQFSSNEESVLLLAEYIYAPWLECVHTFE